MALRKSGRRGNSQVGVNRLVLARDEDIRRACLFVRASDCALIGCTFPLGDRCFALDFELGSLSPLFIKRCRNSLSYRIRCAPDRIGVEMRVSG